jgi:hypothetical protein
MNRHVAKAFHLKFPVAEQMVGLSLKKLCSSLLLTGLIAGNAVAKDALTVGVTSNGFTFTENGNPLSPGTFAVGTLKIYMTVVGTQWPSNLGNVQVDLGVKAGPSGSAPTKYSVPIKLRQAGGDLVLTPTPYLFSVAGLNWTDHSDVNLSVPTEIINDPAFNTDGTELVANLQIEPTKPALHLDTVTTVKIFAKLVHPTTCLRAVNFVSDNGITKNLSSGSGSGADGLEISYKYDPIRDHGTIIGYNFNYVGASPSQLLDDVLIVNTCQTEKNFDLKIHVDSGFSVPTSGQPIKSFVSTNVAVNQTALIDTFAELQTQFPSAYGSADNNGTNLCIADIQLAGMKSLYARADINLITSGFVSAASLPAVGNTDYNNFTADILAVSSPTTCAGSTHSESDGQATAWVNVKSVTCTGQDNCP